MNRHHLAVLAFGDLGLSGIKGKGHMGKDRNRDAKCFVNEDLPWCVAEAILTSDNMGYTVADIIHHIT